MRPPQSTFDARNPDLRLGAGNSHAACLRAISKNPGLVVEKISKKPAGRKSVTNLAEAVFIWAFAVFVIGTGLSAGARAHPLPAAAGVLDDSGTDAPSDSGTEAAPGEDEPQAGTDQPLNTPQEDDPAPGEGFGCPVHEPGPYPLLI